MEKSKTGAPMGGGRLAKKAGPRTKGEVRETSRDTTSGSVLTKVASTKESSSFRDSADNFVTIPRAEFEAMLERLEDLEDALAVEAFRKEFGTGPEAFIPEVVADRLLDGEVPLRAWRTYRGLTQAALGELAGVSRPMIADIETGRKDGSLDTVFALASALKIHPRSLLRLI